MEKILIILAGSPRGGTTTWQSMIDNLKTPLKADLAICTTDEYKKDNILFSSAEYIWLSKEYENWFDYYKLNFEINWKNYFEKGKDTGLYNSGVIHFAFKDIILKKYLDIIKQYKFIIYSRFDQFYLSHPLKFHKDKIMIPEGEDYFGICDRHAIFPSKFAEKFLSICEFVDSEDTKLYDDEFINCEVTFANHLKNIGLYENILRYKRSQFTTAIDSDKTNWRIPIYKIYFFNNLMLKYPDEFLDSVRNLIKFESELIFKNFILILNYFFMKMKINLGDLKKKISKTK